MLRHLLCRPQAASCISKQLCGVAYYLLQYSTMVFNAMQQLLQPAADFARSLQTWQYSERLQATLVASVACSIYLSLVIRRLGPSYSSLLAIAPVLMVNALIPIAFPLEEVLSRLSWSLLLSWLANFKVGRLMQGCIVIAEHPGNMSKPVDQYTSCQPNILLHPQAIGLCLGRGPLVGSWTIPQTVLLYIFPIYPCQGR